MPPPTDDPALFRGGFVRGSKLLGPGFPDAHSLRIRLTAVVGAVQIPKYALGVSSDQRGTFVAFAIQRVSPSVGEPHACNSLPCARGNRFPSESAPFILESIDVSIGAVTTFIIANVDTNTANLVS